MGRYRLLEVLGRGGMGTVWLAEDTVDGRMVALKRPLVNEPELAERARREAGALRLLRISGVVPLLDEGEDEEGRFLVTERIIGQPFPGPCRDPVSLTGLVARLLDVLAGVHAAGIVHRDLKPGNVLVDDERRPWVLDFGIAKGAPLGATLTSIGGVVGTPRYLAPEQMLGRADARADLYAVGLMAYEALSGGLAFADPGIRLFRDLPPIGDVVPELPPQLALLVDALCARLREQRPASAVEALARLGYVRPGARLRWVGPRDGVDALVEAARAGRPLDLAGPPGSGRTRHLEEAAAILVAEGFDVAWMVAGDRPLSSVRSTFGISAGAGPDVCAAIVQERLGAQTVLIVDPPTALDRWSRTLLSSANGAILGLGSAPIPIRPLAELDLRDLFHGPEKVLHLPRDGARALFRRSRGLPARLAEVVAEWIDGGAARVDAGRIRLDPAHAARLPEGPARGAAGPEQIPGIPAAHAILPWVALADGELTLPDLAHVAGIVEWEAELLVGELVDHGLAEVVDGWVVPSRGAQAALTWWSDDELTAGHAALARVLAPGRRTRFGHLVHAGEPEAIAAEAEVVATELGRRGRFAACCQALETAWASTRGQIAASDELRLLRRLVVSAYAAEDAGLRRLARHAIERSELERRGGSWLADLAQASVALAGRRFELAHGLLAEIGELPEEDAEIMRVTMQVEARTRGGPADAEGVLARWEHWAARSPDRRGRWLGWRGLEAYRAARFTEAAGLHCEGGTLRTDDHGRLVAWVNEAMARLEIPDHDGAAAGAARAVEWAASLGQAGLELRAWSVLRAVTYRTGQASAADDELVEAADQVGSVGASGPHLLLEGTVAWRAGDRHLATSLLQRARDRYAGLERGQLGCDVLLATLGVRPVQDWDLRLAPLHGTRAGVQLWAVLRRAELAVGPPPGVVDLAPSDLRLEILSPSEIREAVLEPTSGRDDAGQAG